MQNVTSTPLPKLPTRAADSHKGTYGRVLVIGGSRGMAGAPALAGMAALRSGAGLVTLAVPRSIQATVASFEPSYMTLGFGENDERTIPLYASSELLDQCASMTAIALGPGLSTSDEVPGLVRKLYATVKQPLIVDADGLNAIANEPACLAQPGGPRILTPHPGEFERLTGNSLGATDIERAEQAAMLAQRDTSRQTVVVLKSHRTIVTDGQQYAVNATGNPGMATGGTGDCLTGIITALVAQGLSPWEASRLAAHVHGSAGDLAAAQLGQVSMTASDLIAFLPRAFSQL